DASFKLADATLKRETALAEVLHVEEESRTSWRGEAGRVTDARQFRIDVHELIASVLRIELSAGLEFDADLCGRRNQQGALRCCAALCADVEERLARVVSDRKP